MRALKDFDIRGDGFIDWLTFAEDPRRNGTHIIVRREYDRIAESLDIQQNAGWVAFRKALQGIE